MFSLNVLAFISFLLLSFIAMLSIYTPIANKYMQTLQIKPFMLPFTYILAFYTIGTLVNYFGFENTDFISSLTLSRAFIPLLFALIIFISSMLCSNLTFSLIIVACVTGTVFLQPIGEGFPFSNYPIWAIRLTLILLFSIFCIFYGILNYIPQVMIVYSSVILLGVSLLSGLYAAPVYLALSSALLIGSLGGYLGINLNFIKIPFDNGSCCALAYLISSIILLDTNEYSFSSCLIFTSVFWCEFLTALWRKFVITKSGSLTENTFYTLAAQKYSMQVLLINVAKISSICIFLGWFQLFSINQHSLIFVSLAITFWFNYTFLYPNEKQSLKKANQEFIANLKESVNDVKSVFNPTEDKTETVHRPKKSSVRRKTQPKKVKKDK